MLDAPNSHDRAARVMRCCRHGQLLADRAARAGALMRCCACCRRTARSTSPTAPRAASARWFGRHRVALDNLRQAYPEKTEAEIEAIALDMWGNMARLAAEYIFLDQLFDYDPDSRDARPHRGRRRAASSCASPRENKAAYHLHRPSRQFRAAAGGRRRLRPEGDGAVPPAEQSLHRRLHPLDAARSTMGELLASRRGAAFALARILEAGGNIGVLVDQKFQHGVPTTFFGRACETSPLVPKLARQFDCDVYPARCISACPATASGSSSRRSSSCRATPTARSTSAPPRSCSTTWSNAGCAKIPASGCGSTSAGTISRAPRRRTGCRNAALDDAQPP